MNAMLVMSFFLQQLSYNCSSLLQLANGRVILEENNLPGFLSVSNISNFINHSTVMYLFSKIQTFEPTDTRLMVEMYS